MKPKNMTVSNVCKALARENKMVIEDISSQVSYLIISIHHSYEENMLNAIYHSYQYSKPTKNGFSKIENSGKPFTMDDRINFINGYIDMVDSVNEYCRTDEDAKVYMEVLALAAKDELVKKYGTKGYKTPSLRYMVGMREGYKEVKKSK